MPNGVLWRPCKAVRSLRGEGLRVSLLRQSPLPQMSWRADQAFAGSPARPAVALLLLSGHLYTPGRTPSAGPWTSEESLRDAHALCGGRITENRRPSALIQ